MPVSKAIGYHQELCGFETITPKIISLPLNYFSQIGDINIKKKTTLKHSLSLKVTLLFIMYLIT